MPDVEDMRSTMLIRGGLLTMLLLACRGDEGGTRTTATAAGSVAESAVERDPQLMSLDREVARLEGLVLIGGTATPARRKQFQAEQRRWSADRDACTKQPDVRDCLVASYARQVHEIRRASPHARVGDPRGLSVGPYEAKCSGIESVVEATFINTTPGLLYLESADKAVLLTQVPSASGAKYEKVDGEQRVTFWNKGDQATYERTGSPPANCTMTAVR